MTEVIKPALKLGVTGGIGSGKTTVCRIFNVLGIPVFDADKVAKQIMDTDKSMMLRLNSIAGNDLYLSGTLDRIELAKLIFNNTSLLAKVNELVHPALYDLFNRWAIEQTAPYVILEAAILFESGGAKHLDRILSVVAPVEDRITRVIKRNSLSKEQVLDRIRNQMDNESRIKLSDYVIYNAENEMIIPSIMKIHTEIITSLNTAN